MDKNQHQTDAALAAHNPAVEETQEIDLLLLFDALRKHILIIIATALLFALVTGIAVQFFVTPLYTATTSTYIVSASGGTLGDILSSADLTIASNIAPDYTDIIKSRTILEAVIGRMELPYTYEQLYGNISVSNPSSTHIIKITVTDPDPYRARDIANELTYYAVEQLSEIMGTSVPNVYDEAVAAKSPASPSLMKNVVIAFVLGAVLSAGVIVFLAVMDTSIKTAEDIENRCGLVTLTKVYDEGIKKKKHGYGYGYGYGYGGNGETGASSPDKKDI